MVQEKISYNMLCNHMHDISLVWNMTYFMFGNVTRYGKTDHSWFVTVVQYRAHKVEQRLFFELRIVLIYETMILSLPVAQVWHRSDVRRPRNKREKRNGRLPRYGAVAVIGQLKSTWTDNSQHPGLVVQSYGDCPRSEGEEERVCKRVSVSRGSVKQTLRSNWIYLVQAYFHLRLSQAWQDSIAQYTWCHTHYISTHA